MSLVNPVLTKIKSIFPFFDVNKSDFMSPIYTAFFLSILNLLIIEFICRGLGLPGKNLFGVQILSNLKLNFLSNIFVLVVSLDVKSAIFFPSF